MFISRDREGARVLLKVKRLFSEGVLRILLSYLNIFDQFRCILSPVAQLYVVPKGIRLNLSQSKTIYVK